MLLDALVHSMSAPTVLAFAHPTGSPNPSCRVSPSLSLTNSFPSLRRRISGGTFDPLPGGIALTVGNAFDLIEPRHRVSDMVAFSKGSFRSRGNASAPLSIRFLASVVNLSRDANVTCRTGFQCVFKATAKSVFAAASALQLADPSRLDI